MDFDSMRILGQTGLILIIPWGAKRNFADDWPVPILHLGLPGNPSLSTSSDPSDDR